MSTLRKVAVGLKVLQETEETMLPQFGALTSMELSQRQKNLAIMHSFSELLHGFEPVQGATPFFRTDIMDLPLCVLKEMPSAAHTLFPFQAPAGMSGPQLSH